ncbi:hypothetical protein LLH06_10945 [Mucilaginibacter daejeonensis]|uniref:hypothetical protein n=1 Tax=Mucilaginibacter daejeonensis TaxID=398049 RepID=UPI001D172676|nr:hypothetical protein [Mucilaginibacter daejeonensis]UEG51490.1 hypothetical protein LLH06_10945 [Mucilaginibacter daejeonensis]
MNGTTSQLLSLITHGNYFLSKGEVAPGYYPNNITFQFCNTIEFLHLATDPDGTAREQMIAADPIAWFNVLKGDGCYQLKAYYHPSEEGPDRTPDHKMAGFVGGGGTWLMEAIYPSYSDFWAPRWVVARQDDPERKIWSVSYGRTVGQTDTIDFCPDTMQIRETFKDILIDIEAFAREHELNNWADIFKGALNVLNGAAPSNNWYSEQINENGYDRPALQLLYAAMSAHVFGGMGSWNDLGFEKEEDAQRYEDLSFYLYDQINRALLSSINSVNGQWSLARP